jgi:hypothetical protein
MYCLWPALAPVLLGYPLQAATLAPLSWQDLPGGRSAVLTLPETGKTGFTTLDPARSGIAFTNQLAESRYLTNQILLNGSGVAAGDVDGDGQCDLYFCGMDVPNALYRNLGNWHFEDITTSAGVACPDQPSTGAVLADVDGDGDLDLLVTASGVVRVCFAMTAAPDSPRSSCRRSAAVRALLMAWPT